jgi:hypothetical protein
VSRPCAPSPWAGVCSKVFSARRFFPPANARHPGACSPLPHTPAIGLSAGCRFPVRLHQENRRWPKGKGGEVGQLGKIEGYRLALREERALGWRQGRPGQNPDDNVVGIKPYDDYDGVVDLAHCREDEPLQFELHQCFAESMYAAQCSRCDGLGCERCCGDDGELDTCGTCEGPGCFECSFTGKRREQPQAVSLGAEESQALRSAQDSFEHAKSRNPSYQLWMGAVTNSLCGICSQPAGITSYPAKCKHLFHRHCLEACQSSLHCEFCGRSVTVAFDQPSELWRAADPQQALRDAICACSTKHDRKAFEKKRERTHHRDERHAKRRKAG